MRNDSSRNECGLLRLSWTLCVDIDRLSILLLLDFLSRLTLLQILEIDQSLDGVVLLGDRRALVLFLFFDSSPDLEFHRLFQSIGFYWYICSCE